MIDPEGSPAQLDTRSAVADPAAAGLAPDTGDAAVVA